jgi:hypothetical protein
MMKLMAGAILSVMVGGLGWAGSNMFDYSKRIAVLETRELSHKELIIRVDKKVDKVGSKLDKLLERIK